METSVKKDRQKENQFVKLISLGYQLILFRKYEVEKTLELKSKNLCLSR